MKAACEGDDRVKPEMLVPLVRAAHVLEVEEGAETEEVARALEVLRRLVQEKGIGAVAMDIGVDPSNLWKIIKGKRQLSNTLRASLVQALKIATCRKT